MFVEDFIIKNQKEMKVSLMSVILLVRNVPQAIKFYNESVGMQLIASTDSWADLEASKDVKLTLKQVEGFFFSFLYYFFYKKI